MKSICINFFLILFALLSLTQPLFAQRGGIYIGKVDLYTVGMLHPSMIWYNPEHHAFTVQRDDAAKKKLATNNKNIEEERKKIESRMKILKSRIKEEDNRFNETIGNLNQKYAEKKVGIATATEALNKINYKRRIEEATAKHRVTINSYYGEYTLCEEQLERIGNNVEDNLTTIAETEKRFNDIINEIKAYAKRAADQKGISIVLNSGYKKLILRTQKANKNNFNPTSGINEFAVIFTSPFPKELLNDEASIAGYYKGIESKTQSWLEKGNTVFGDYTKKFIDEDILVGGVDLTQDVLAALYKAYKFDPNISNSILQSLKK